MSRPQIDNFVAAREIFRGRNFFGNFLWSKFLRHPIPYSLIKIEDKYHENLRTKLLVKVQTNPQTNSCRQICCTNCPKIYIRNVIYFADKLYSQTLWTNFADKLGRHFADKFCRQTLQTILSHNSPITVWQIATQPYLILLI